MDLLKHQETKKQASNKENQATRTKKSTKKQAPKQAPRTKHQVSSIKYQKNFK